MKTDQKKTETLQTLSDAELAQVAGGRRGHGSGRSSN
jgi:bacteriocin-like protein